MFARNSMNWTLNIDGTLLALNVSQRKGEEGKRFSFRGLSYCAKHNSMLFNVFYESVVLGRVESALFELLQIKH